MVSPRLLLALALLMLAQYLTAPAGAESIPRDEFARVARLGAGTAQAGSARAEARGLTGDRSALISGLRLYRFLLASQDAGHCRFRPSCSVFTENAVNHAGALRGILIGSDRLQRCHPFASRYYERFADGRLYDPLDSYLARDPACLNFSSRAPEHDSTGTSVYIHRSTLAAGLFSAVIPGAGKVYAHRPLDGLASLIATGLPFTFAVQNFERAGPRSARGWIHASLSGGFYLGNIWGSIAAARLAGSRALRPDVSSPRSSSEYAFDRQASSNDSIAAISGSDTAAVLYYGTACATFAAGLYPQAAARFLDIAEQLPGTQTGANARFFQAMSHAEAHDWEAAASALSLFPIMGTAPADSARIARALELLRRPERKHELSSRLAQALSIVVPGLGQWYARDVVGGFKALGVVGACGYYVHDTYRTRSSAELVLAAVPLFWRTIAETFRRRLEQSSATAFAAKGDICCGSMHSWIFPRRQRLDRALRGSPGFIGHGWLDEFSSTAMFAGPHSGFGATIAESRLRCDPERAQLEPVADRNDGAYATRRRVWWRRRGVVLAAAPAATVPPELAGDRSALRARKRRWAELLRLIYNDRSRIPPPTPDRAGGEFGGWDPVGVALSGRGDGPRAELGDWSIYGGLLHYALASQRRHPACVSFSFVLPWPRRS